MAFRTLSKEARARLTKKLARQREEAEAIAKTEGLVACFSFVACADGRASGAEAPFATRFLRETYPDLSSPLSPISMSNATDEGNLRRIRVLWSVCQPPLTERRRLLEALLECAASDGELDQREEAAIEKVASLLRVKPETLTRVWRRWEGVRRIHSGTARRKRSTKSRTRASTVPAPPSWCYQLLGCTESDSDEDIKKGIQKARESAPSRRPLVEHRDPRSAGSSREALSKAPISLRSDSSLSARMRAVRGSTETQSSLEVP
jgi:uncharacterized tellurite resistance protein B-like protein